VSKYDFNDVYAYGGVGELPFSPHDSDNWMCQVEVDGVKSFKSCPAIELDCVRGWSEAPSQAPIGAPTIELPDELAPNFYFISSEIDVVTTINFAEARFEAIIQDDGKLVKGGGIMFLDQYTLLVSSTGANIILKYNVNGT